MLFDAIIGHNDLKKQLTETVAAGRIPHAQLFVAPEGTGGLAMAIAYAQLILSQNTNSANTPFLNLQDKTAANYQHPDLHFIFPSNNKPGKDMSSSDYMKEWEEFRSANVYENYLKWSTYLPGASIPGIKVKDAADLNNALRLKAFAEGYKVVIIWGAETMNEVFANKILKEIEEPLPNTALILVCESTKRILPTILSRCQLVPMQPLHNHEIEDFLRSKYNLTPAQTASLGRRAQGSLLKAIQLMEDNSEEIEFETEFVRWVRAAFKAKGNPTSIIELLKWSETVASWDRERQKKFIHFCLELFRQALLLNYQSPSLVYYETSVDNFKLEKFAPFVNGENIQEIAKELNQAYVQIVQSGNAKIVFSDLSIKLTRLIHKK